MTAAKFERSREALVKDFSDVLGEAETLLKQAAKESGERASDLRSQVETKLRSAKMRLQDMQDDALDSAKAAARATVEFEEERERITAMLVLIVVATVFGCFALVALSVLVVVWLWDRSPLLAITGVTIFYVLIAAGAVLALKQQLQAH